VVPARQREYLYLVLGELCEFEQGRIDFGSAHTPQQIFLFAIIGILLVDYYIVSKGRMDLAQLYTADPKGLYCAYRRVAWALVARHTPEPRASFVTLF
jgi:hypothetical protein